MNSCAEARKTLGSKRILVTGGTGFIGGRLIEKLAAGCRTPIRVLVRDFSRACRIARFPIEMARGDVTDADCVSRAAAGCDVVFHCAYGNSGSEEQQRAVNVRGTRNVLEASLQAGVRRVVHLSTVLVYGHTSDGDLDEDAPRRLLGHVYADSKLEGEKLALDYARRRSLPVTVLQPTAVFGPFAPIWTEYVLHQLKTRKVILVDGGEGLCNAVYVDDLADAMILAAVKPEAEGEAFLISGAHPATWKQFYQRHERMLGISSTVCMSAAEACAYYRAAQREAAPNFLAKELWTLLCHEPKVRERLFRTYEAALLMKLARLVVPENARHGALRIVTGTNGGNPSGQAGPSEKPVHPLDPLTIRLSQSKTRVSIDKARRLLGYRPLYTFEDGMKATEAWARWSNLLNASEQSAVSS